jgi:hypothetical protein
MLVAPPSEPPPPLPDLGKDDEAAPLSFDGCDGVEVEVVIEPE